MDERILRRAYNDILAGRTKTKFGKTWVWIKHFSSTDQCGVDEIYQESYDLARNRKRPAPTNEEALAAARKEKRWTAADDLAIKSAERTILALEDNIRIQYAPSELEKLKNQLKEERERLRVKESQKAAAMNSPTLTCESFADKRANAYYVYSSLFKDEGLAKPLYDLNDFEDLEDYQLGLLIRLYNETMENCSGGAIQQIAAANFFQNVFRLAENIYYFYGIPIARLTYFQSELASNGRYFSQVFDELGDTMPINIKNDPAKIVDWVLCYKNVKKKIDAAPEKGSMGLNMTKADMKLLGIDKLADNASDRLKKSGKKELTMEELAQGY